MGLSEGERAELQAALRSDQYDGSISSRAQIVLWWDEGRRKIDIARALGTTRPTVDKWIARYEQLELSVMTASPGGNAGSMAGAEAYLRSRTARSSTWPATLGS